MLENLKNIYIRKIKEEQEKEKLKKNKTKSSNKKSTVRLTEKEKFTQERSSKEDKEFIETNMPQREN